MFKSEGLIDKSSGELNHSATTFEGGRLARFRQQKLPSQILLLLIEWPIALGVWLVGTYQLFLALRVVLGGADSELASISLLCLACIGAMIPMAIYSLLAERYRKKLRLLLIDVVAVGAIILWLVVPVYQAYTQQRIAKTEVKVEAASENITLSAPAVSSSAGR